MVCQKTKHKWLYNRNLTYTIKRSKRQIEKLLRPNGET